MKYILIAFLLLTACATTKPKPVVDRKAEAAIELALQNIIKNIREVESHMIPEFQIFIEQKCGEVKSALCEELYWHLQDDVSARVELYDELRTEGKKLNALVMSTQDVR